MVRVLFISFCLLLFQSTLVLASSLEVNLNKTEIEQGKFILIDIVFIGDLVPQDPNLKKWEVDFHIDYRDLDVINLKDGLVKTTTTLRLFPRTKGKKILGSIVIEDAISVPQAINVLPLEREGIDGSLKLSVITKEVWQGELFDIVVDVPYLHPSNRIVVGEFDNKKIDVVSIKEKQISMDGISFKRIHWKLRSNSQGLLSLELPVIKQRGRGRWLYYLPHLEINVLPIPAYLPATVPIGFLSIESFVDENKGKLNWVISVLNEGQKTENVYGMVTALADLTSISPEEIIQVDNIYTVSVPVWSWGWGNSNQLHIRYFDTKLGKLVLLSHHLPAVWSVPKLAQLMMFVLSLLAFLWISAFLTYYIRFIYRKKQYIRTVLAAENGSQIRQFMLNKGEWSSLDDWLLDHPHGMTPKLVFELNSCCFSQRNNPIDSVKSLFKTIAKAREYKK